MKTHRTHGAAGFVIIEALVALIVVAVGILGIAKLNSVLLQGTGLTKARSEAIELAQDRIETARDFNLDSACNVANFQATTESATGVNALYSISTTYPASGTDWQAVEVCVTWDGGSCGSIGNRIILRSTIACNSLGTSAMIGASSAGGLTGGFIKTPTGRGKVGGRNYGSTVGTQNTITIDGINANDGTRTYTNSTDGAKELVDSTGKVLLTINKLSCETSAPEFSTISGKVFVEAKNGSPIANSENLYVLSSDASYCAKLTGSYSNYYGVLPEGSTGNSIKYFYTYYQCYIGPEWWGNIGVVRTDNANSNQRVCVGNPIASNTGTIFSKHPQLGTNRAYRGYREVSSGIYESKGIGEQETYSTSCTTEREYIAQHLEKHHFVHLTLTGNTSDSSCSTPQATLNTYTPTNSLGTSGGNTTSGTNPLTVTATNSPGKYYCMSNSDGVTCPDLVTTATTPQTLLHGTITNYTASSGSISAIDSNGSSCTTESITANGSTSYTYSCVINWTGFTGSSWNGAIQFTSANTLCPGSASPAVLPSGSNVSYTVNASNAQTYPNSIQFTDIPNSVTDISLDFDVKTSTCGTLGQPNLSAWTFGGSGSNSPSASISWDAITGATGYKIRTCDITGQNTSCDPSTATVATQTALSFSTTAKKSLCVMVTATDGSSDGTSATKCVKYTGGTTKAYSNW
jgi:hypothetical protein